MVLKAKILSLYKNLIVSKYRKVNQLVRLYTDYIDFVKDEAKLKIDRKIQTWKTRLYNEYQKQYYDVADEKEIFTVVYTHKYEQFKKDYRMKFRVVRENLRREIKCLEKTNAKLTLKIEKLSSNTEVDNSSKINELNSIIVHNNAQIEEIKVKIPQEEVRYANMVEEAANALKAEFEAQKLEGLKRNALKFGMSTVFRVNFRRILKEVTNNVSNLEYEEELNLGHTLFLKKEIEKKIKRQSKLITESINSDLDKKCSRIAAKIEKYKARSAKLKVKVDKAVELYAQEDAKVVKGSANSQIEKLNKEIAAYEVKFMESKTDADKEKYTKILNSLKGDLSLLGSTGKAKEEIIKDDEILAIDDLCMYFGGIKAVNHLSFSVKGKEIFGLIGPNGAGKTTVFNCITQFYKPTAGNIIFRNKNDEIVDLTKEKVHNVILQGVVRTFQNLEVIKDITVLDNLLIAAHRDYTSGLFRHMLHTRILKVEENVIKSRALKVLKFMGLLKYKDMYAWGLPYGILKKIEIARTLMCNPQLIILDEPAAGLNDSETVELANLIRKIRDEYNSTILLVEHDMGLVMDVCDRICAISFGNLLALGTPKEIQEDKGVQEAYLGVSED